MMAHLSKCNTGKKTRKPEFPSYFLTFSKSVYIFEPLFSNLAT